MLSVKSVKIKKKITYNLLIYDPIVYLALYQFLYESLDLNIL